jgi:outer membrane protein, multidrug efflux system
MATKRIYRYAAITALSLLIGACTLPPKLVPRTENKNVPQSYKESLDTLNSGKVQWKEYFTDPYLVMLIDSALKNNQELNIMMREIDIAQNEIRARKGEYLPFVDFGGDAGLEKVSRYTRDGSVEANSEIMPGTEFPEPLPNFMLSVNASWEIDIWSKLRNAKKAAVFNYLATTEGRNFMITNLVAEIANSYYELMALDNQLDILKQNIQIQQNALEIVRQQKTAARVTELAVRRFEAEVLKNQSRQFLVQQEIVETENRINFLVGRFPQTIQRSSDGFQGLAPNIPQSGIPSQLLANRPDIRQAELNLAAAKLDVKVARANFYPSLRINAGVGLQAFDAKYLITDPKSLMYYLAAGLVAPLINRNAIKAQYYSANARQIQAVYNYERAILNGYVEVANQMSNLSNLDQSLSFRTRQVATLNESIEISGRLFRNARADYVEILLTQRDALEARTELVDTKLRQWHAMVNIYKALGGGWK